MSFSGMVEIPPPSTLLRACFRRSKIRRNVSQVNMSTVCSDKGNPVRHARAGGHPGWTAKELDSRFRGNDGRGHFPVGFKPT